MRGLASPGGVDGYSVEDSPCAPFPCIPRAEATYAGGLIRYYNKYKTHTFSAHRSRFHVP